MKASFSLALQ